MFKLGLETTYSLKLLSSLRYLPVSSESLTSLLSSRVEVSSLDFEVDSIDQSPFRSFALRTHVYGKF